jgi:competence protein ComEC
MRDPTYHAGEGILFLGYQRGNAQIRKAAEEAVTNLGIELNRNIGKLLTNLFPGDVEAFARALLLGDDYDLNYETDTALKLSGIRHIVAVSGLHVAILYTILRTVTLKKRWLTALIGIPVLYLFAAVALFTPSVTRACIMVALMILAQLIDREYDSATALAFAVLVMLAENPLVITSVSFQMSVGCVTGILLFQESISKWLQGTIGVPKGKTVKARLKRWFVSSVSVSLSATVLTVPMSAYYFGTISLVGVLANLMTLWAVSLSFYGIVAACILALISLKIGSLAAFVTAVPMRYVLWTAKFLSRFPLAAVYTKSIWIILWLAFVYILLAVFLLSKNRRPLELSCCAAVGLCLALVISWNEHQLWDTHFTALDVGQGQCLILHHDDKTFLIDCGGSNDEIAANTAAETLLSRGITHLDGIILTHGDRDHAGGIGYLLTRFDTDFIMLPSTTAPDTVESIAANWTDKVIPVSENLIVDTGEGIITVFGPTFAAESNENSLCILFESEKCVILVTGDRGALGEMLLTHEAELPDVDLLVAGHHGSKNSTTDELLTITQPETVFISVGNNAYGHPADALLERLKSHGCEIYRTDLNGTIIFRR